MANEKRLIDANDVPKLFEKKYKETQQRILDGETYLDTLAEGFTEADDVIQAMPTVEAVPMAQHNELKERYKKLLETANILDAALREYQRKYGDLEE